ncbi:MAG: protein kinase [Deltaproteobacteria bacterium]|nr:protein kinase [Deltaproteobacteria bacterium]
MSLVGKKVGHFRLTAPLGEGGMGAVYVAQHEMIGRRAAIKVLHQGVGADASLVERFFDEARAANRVEHPGIVEIYDCGVDETLGPYLVMELLEGESLLQYLNRERVLDTDFLIRLVVEVADAVGDAHAAGVVHRDLKPDNLFLLRGKQRISKVLDFGIARLMERGGSRLTGHFDIMGTPLYMAPEQCEGAAAVDHRADVYALGVICYELLVGQPPFVHENIGRVLAMHLYEAPALGSLAPPLQDVLGRALAKKSTDRFLSVRLFADAFIAAIRGRPLPAQREIPVLATIEPAPTATPAIPATMIVRRAKSCPRCATEYLESVRFGEVELDCCQECGGVWLDRGELHALNRESLGAGTSPMDLQRRGLQGPMPCPSCGEHLISCWASVDDGKRLDVDFCEVCGGLWLDEGELAQIQRDQAARIFSDLRLDALDASSE